MSSAGRRCPKLMPTMTSVPPATATASGWAAFASSASAQVVGCRKSMVALLVGVSGEVTVAASCYARRRFDVFQDTCLGTSLPGTFRTEELATDEHRPEH